MTTKMVNPDAHRANSVKTADSGNSLGRIMGRQRLTLQLDVHNATNGRHERTSTALTCKETSRHDSLPDGLQPTRPRLKKSSRFPRVTRSQVTSKIQYAYCTLLFHSV